MAPEESNQVISPAGENMNEDKDDQNLAIGMEQEPLTK